ncbi:PREDICTED: TBC1 domain family member 15 [Lupinus angustifolius]|uniref:TBC1 domain family member 15 n=1 Tax=Lupinus angustifolius TaxID=3871 RepID=UPI00092E7946|nr:PREDICTED: TBC1 domain family member 15 [Lupinus angustifolius]XP_019433051.1 PREDICTED: TBC1 domain family member 15 [Lupinus angustifolius]
MIGCGGLWRRVFMMSSGATELNTFYPIRPECQNDVPVTRFKPRAGKTLSARRWHASFSADGRLNIAKVLRRIQRGGVHPSIKGVVWEFLLGCYDPNSTFDERNELKQRRRGQYDMWKAECQKMVPVIGSGKFITTPLIGDDSKPIDPSLVGVPTSDNKVLQWLQVLHQIGLDVVRTDRALAFYETEANQAKLWDVLAVFAWLNSDIGYVQGMNDICSPLIILIENEADCFWCFERAMRRLRENFRCSASSMGVQSQLSTLSQIMKTVDPKLHQHLEDLDGGEYLFAFRMLMVLFRREFSFADTLYLWELMWGMEYNPNIFSKYEEPDRTKAKESSSAINDKMLKQYGKFERKNVKTGNTQESYSLAIFLVASVLEIKNRRILNEAKGVDDVVQILGDITSNLDAKKACTEALKIQKKYLSKAKKA